MSPLRTMLVLALVIQLVAVVVFVLSVQGSASVASARALTTLTSGTYSLMFWVGAVVVGSVLPLLIGLVDFKRRSPGLTALASVLVLVGGFLVKYVIVAAGQV
jgi:polysulfide reductase chain C